MDVPEEREEQMEELNQKENPGMIRDRVGELTDLSECPVCAEHPDCFANIEGCCTALKKVDDGSPCPFYKNAEANMADARRSYQRLKENGRSDLISRYIKPLSAMGLLDDEIAVGACMDAMADYAKGGPAFYPLEEAFQDHYVCLLIREAARSGHPIYACSQVWQKGT